MASNKVIIGGAAAIFVVFIGVVWFVWDPTPEPEMAVEIPSPPAPPAVAEEPEEVATSPPADKKEDISAPSQDDAEPVFDIDVHLCGAPQYGFVDIQGEIKNMSPNHYDRVEYVTKLLSGGDVIRLDKQYIYGMAPGSTYFVDDMMMHEGQYEQCSIQVVSVR